MLADRRHKFVRAIRCGSRQACQCLCLREERATPTSDSRSSDHGPEGCRFVPHVVAVAVGGIVRFTNSDPTMHNVHTMAVQSGNKSIDVSQAPNAPVATLTYSQPEQMVPVRCNNHPWMNGFINVSPNTFFAVSGPNGSFTIPGLPQGTYTVAFVHEVLGEQDVQVTITAQHSTQISAAFQTK